MLHSKMICFPLVPYGTSLSREQLVLEYSAIKQKDLEVDSVMFYTMCIQLSVW